MSKGFFIYFYLIFSPLNGWPFWSGVEYSLRGGERCGAVGTFTERRGEVWPGWSQVASSPGPLLPSPEVAARRCSKSCFPSKSPLLVEPHT